MVEEKNIFSNVEVGKTITPDEFGSAVDLNTPVVQQNSNEEDETEVVTSQRRVNVILSSEAKIPERKLMDGEIVRIKKIDVSFIPIDSNTKWKLSKNNKEYIPVTFRLFFSSDKPEFNSQTETVSGLKAFKNVVEENGVKKIKVGIGNIWGDKDNTNQLYDLKELYSKFINKKEVTDGEFQRALNEDNLKVRLCVKDVKNPQTNKMIKKNIVAEFLK